MNKIYKVIWSKAKHTYVVASEIAKGHTKGETTGKGLKKLAAAMLVAAALLSPSFAWAADKATVTDTTNNTTVEVYTTEGADKQISELSTLIGNNTTNINTNTTNINGLNTRVTALETADKNSVTEVTGSDAKLTITKVNGSTSEVTIDNVNHATSADSATTAESATKATQDGNGNEISTTYATKTEVKEADEKLDSRITAVKEFLQTETENRYVSQDSLASELEVKAAGVVKEDQTIGENVSALGKALDDETNARIWADKSQDKRINEAAAGIAAVNTALATQVDKLNQQDSNEAATRAAKDTELNERITNEANAIHDEIKAGDKALDTRITNVKEYVLSETVSKTDAAVQDGAIVKAANTIGDNVTKLDAALAKETAARIGADKAQDKVIQQVNQNMVDGFNTINKNMAAGFNALSTADANELAGRVAADTELVKATNGGLALNDKNVLQKNETTIENGTVTTKTTAADILIVNEGATNQITLSKNGIKVGTNSTVIASDGVFAGGDTADKAKAALNADGSIKGAKGNFTVDGTTGDVNTKGSVTAASGTIGNVSMSADGTVTGVKDLTASGKVTADSFTDGTATMSNGSLNGVNQINATGNIVTTGNMKAHDITAEGTIKGETINGTTGTFGSLTTTSNASVGGKLTANGITNTGNVITDTLTVNHNATVGGDLGVTGDITGKSLNVGAGDIKGGQITGTGLDVGAGTIKTTGAVETGTLTTTGDATIGGNLTVDKDLTVNGKFNAKTLSSRLDETNYTTINGGNVTSVNNKVDTDDGKTYTSSSKLTEKGRTDTAAVGNITNVSTQTATESKSTIENSANTDVTQKSYITQNLKNILQGIQNGDNATTVNQTETGIKSTATDGKNTASTNLSNKGFNTYATDETNTTYTLQTAESLTSQIGDDGKVKSVMNADGITNNADGGTITNDAGKLVNTASDTIANMAGNDITNTSTNGNIANTAANGTISNNAKNLTNTASENITNKAENGNISNIASNGTISNEAKTISNKANEALTNDAKTITNTASESVTTQIGNGSEVQSVMNGDGIANKATGKSITNDAATITNTGTTSVTNQVGENKVLVDTTHVQSAFGDTIYTTWAESGITNNATDKTVATNAKDILNTATGDITNTAKNGTITNDAGKLVNTASDTIANMAGNDITNTSTNGNIANTAANGTISNNAKNLTNTASENITNKAENGNISNIASNGTISNEAKTISNKANEALTNDAKTITNTASESVTTQIGNGSEVQSVMNGDGIANKATGKSITNDAATITNTGTTSVTNQVGENKVLVDITHVQSAFGDTIYTTWNESGITDKVGENVERTMGTSKITESVTDGTKSNTFTKNAEKDINIVTDGTNTSTESQLAGSVNTSLKVVDAEGKTTQSLSNMKTVSEDTTKITDTASGAFSSSSQKADSITSTVKDTKTGTISERSQTVSQVQDKVGTTTVTTTDGLTKLTNEAGTHKTEMDFAEVLKDLGVRGNASVGKDLTVAGKSTLTGDVTMENNATVKRKLTVEGETNLKNTKVDGTLDVTGKSTLKGSLEVTGGTTTDTLHVTSTSQFDGAATFKDIVTMEKDLNVGGNVDAASYKVDGKTYIDKDGINANGQVIKNVGQGDISEGSHDAVTGGQLYETNTRVTGLETRVDKLDNKIDKVGANAAAMANLHPLEFDEDSKWNIAAAVGSSGSETASAVGVFYRPNENVMVNASVAMGTGENMFGGGVSLRLGHGGNKAKEAQMKAAAKENRELRAKVDDLTARMDALLSVLNPNMSKDFPDVPENHWAYEAVSRLAGNGIVEGYEDGKYHGERQMTRYEMAEIIYNALSKGAKAEKKLVEEFRPELQAMAAQKKA